MDRYMKVEKAFSEVSYADLEVRAMAHLGEKIDRFIAGQPDVTRYRREPALSKQLMTERVLRNVADAKAVDALVLEIMVKNALERINYGT